MSFQGTCGYFWRRSSGIRLTASPSTSITRSNAKASRQSTFSSGRLLPAQSSRACRAYSAIWRSVTPGSCSLINGQRLTQNLVSKILAEPLRRVEIDLLPDDFRQLISVTEEYQSGTHAWSKLDQHVHVATQWIKIIAQHRVEDAQFAGASHATKFGNFLAINLDWQFSDAHAAIVANIGAVV